MDQFDYSTGDYSPAAHVTISGGTIIGSIALAFGLMAFGGVITMAIMVNANIEAKAQAASAAGVVRAQIAEREARIALDTTTQFQVELAKRGIEIKR